MKKWLLLIGSVFGAFAALGIFFTNQMMYIRKKTDKVIIDRDTEDGFYDEKVYSTLPKEAFVLPSSLGYNIAGTVIKQHENNRFMILSHGVTVHSLNSMKYARLFLKLGWNVVLYDHRRHGKSEGKTTSYGYYEKLDLQSVVHWVKEQFGSTISLGIHGESMGAATTLLYAGMEDGADFYIVDCPFSDLEELLAYRLKQDFHLPKQLVMPAANIILKWREGYSFNDVSPISVVDQIKHPVLFIHSKEDDYILPKMTEQLHAKKRGAKRMYLAPVGTHARSYADNPEEYEQVIESFLEKIQKEAL
ncbi:alpha/beta hydrolase [Priestia megaterium]|uniref:alpha/beta hydrolase n=1 Tax=Priestia megaterium TaxID=1404 RepID=UPI002E1B3FE7|nr:alpha/beta hydrolase [Priestia megaterium]